MRNVAATLLAAVALPTMVSAQSGTANVNTTMSTYLAGGNTYSVAPVGGGGIAPFLVVLAPGTGRVLTFSSVTGTATFCGGGTCGTPSADGPSIGGTSLNASGSISGMSAPSSGFLAGVFLGASLPAAAPSTIDFNALGLNFLTLSPLLGQQFFIGNGQTAGNVIQQFFVPDGATALYLGIADGGSFVGNPGFYGDNVGTYVAEYAISAATVVPEPSSIALLATGMIALAVIGKRRKSRV